MATTDARTGFRLPWSSDQRPQSDDGAEAPTADDAAPAPSSEAQVDASAEPAPDPAAEGSHDMAEPATAESQTHTDAEADAVAGSPAAGEAVPAAAPSAPAKRPNKFLADLTKAMQAAAESARDEAMSRIQADAKSHIEAIHERSATDAADLRRKADDDVAAIREWSKTEIARIREETDQKISARKGNLEFEIEEHAARIERQIEHVQGRVSGFESEMAQFFERLLGEEDPTRFASLAENLPEPPPFDLDELAASAWLAPAASTIDQAEAPEAATDPTETGATEAAAETTADGPTDDPEAAMAAIEAAAQAAGWEELNAAEAEAVAEPLDGSSGGESVDESDPRLSALSMTADFAAAEAEAFEAAGTADESEEIPTIGDDALASRIAGLVPAQGDDAPAAETRTTKVVVSGLVSVASIASFKRHLGRLAGVQSVGVSSGPEGEFVFAVSHAPDQVLRDSVPTLPGFGARVTGGDDETLDVTAKDPESEG